VHGLRLPQTWPPPPSFYKDEKRKGRRSNRMRKLVMVADGAALTADALVGKHVRARADVELLADVALDLVGLLYHLGSKRHRVLAADAADLDLDVVGGSRSRGDLKLRSTRRRRNW
jgi:hypothetical protein